MGFWRKARRAAARAAKAVSPARAVSAATRGVEQATDVLADATAGWPVVGTLTRGVEDAGDILAGAGAAGATLADTLVNVAAFPEDTLQHLQQGGAVALAQFTADVAEVTAIRRALERGELEEVREILEDAKTRAKLTEMFAGDEAETRSALGELARTAKEREALLSMFGE